MTRKQMKKLAQELYRCERVYQNPTSSLEEKSRAEGRIIELTNLLMTQEDGIKALLEIDTMIQGLAKRNFN